MAAIRRLATATLSAFAALAAFVLYGHGRLNNDTMWSIAWGGQILRGRVPDFDVGPTPHPLPNALGVLVAPLGASAEVVVLFLGFLSAGLLVYCTSLATYRTYGAFAGIAAGALVLAIPPMMTATAFAYVDVPYAALMLTAVSLEIVRPRRGVATLAVLALAGLLRPEAWFVSAAYLIWLAPSLRTWRARVGYASLATASPALWMSVDWLTTGNALFGLAHTTQATESTGRPTGISAIVELPRFAADNVGSLVCLAALVGVVGALRSARGRLALGCLVVITGAGAIPVLAGTPLNDRYFLATFALLALFAAGGAFGWVGDTIAWWKYAGIGCCAALVFQAAINMGNVEDRRETFAEMAHRRDAAKAALTSGRIPCRPLVVPSLRVRMLAAVWTGVPLEQVLDANEYRADGTYLTGTARAVRGVATLDGRPGTAAPPPHGTIFIRSSRGWQLRKRC